MFKALAEAPRHPLAQRVPSELKADGAVRLTIRHEIDKPGAKLVDAVAGGWPKVLSSLKSMLETGAALPNLSGHGKPS